MIWGRPDGPAAIVIARCVMGLLLAMPRRMERTSDRETKTGRARQARPRPMPVRQDLLRDRCARVVGLARSLLGEPARARRGVCDLCRKLAQALADHQGRTRDHPLRGQGHENRAQLLRPMRHAAVLRTGAFAAYGEHPACAFFGPYRPAAALSRRHRGIAGVDLYRRAAGAAERFSRGGLAALEEEAPRS